MPRGDLAQLRLGDPQDLAGDEVGELVARTEHGIGREHAIEHELRAVRDAHADARIRRRLLADREILGGVADDIERDADPLAELRSLYGHVELGVHAEVVDGGRFSIGDAMELLEL